MKKLLLVAACVVCVAVAQAGEKQKETKANSKNDKTPACCAQGKTEVSDSCSEGKACCSADTKVAKANAKTETRVALLSPKAAEAKR